MSLYLPHDWPKENEFKVIRKIYTNLRTGNIVNEIPPDDEFKDEFNPIYIIKDYLKGNWQFAQFKHPNVAGRNHMYKRPLWWKRIWSYTAKYGKKDKSAYQLGEKSVKYYYDLREIVFPKIVEKWEFDKKLTNKGKELGDLYDNL
jgi:hypothetical protein